MSFFFFYKIEEQEGRIGPAWGWGLISLGEGRMWEKDVGGWIWCKYYVHMYVNRKMIPVETVPRMREAGE
jgi:hypothetical protein